MQEIFEKIIQEIHNASGCDGSCEYDKGWDEAIREAETIVEKIVVDYDNGWIPVEERLPDEVEMVLVTCQNKKGGKSVNRAYYSSGTWHGSGSMAGVTAWMPLPEPYDLEMLREAGRTAGEDAATGGLMPAT